MPRAATRPRPNRAAVEPQWLFAPRAFGYTVLSMKAVADRGGMRFREENGRSDRIRTCDVLLPKQVLYQAELRSDWAHDCTIAGSLKNNLAFIRCPRHHPGTVPCIEIKKSSLSCRPTTPRTTLRQTYDEVREQQLVDLIILVDDQSRDDTVAVARELEGVQVHVHEKNTGYGGNQKTCYRLALEAGADIVVMIHPDYQYTPKLLPAMVSMIGNGLYPCVLGSRILGGYSLQGGMPVWKYVANRALTLVENLLLGAKLSEYHTGYRAFSREILERSISVPTPTTSSSTTRCSRRFSGTVSRSAK